MGKLTYRTLRESVVEEIRNKILDQEFEPGMRIIEQNLSKELGVSRGPIREALRQLEQEGLVEYIRNVGCSVRKITIRDLYEIYLLRANYETLAVRMCGGAFTEEELDEMEKILVRMSNIDNNRDVVACDHELHGVIVRKSQSERLIKAWTDLDYGSIVSSYINNFEEDKTAKRQLKIHKELLDACRTNDVRFICEAINLHYMNSVARFVDEEGIAREEFALLRPL